MYNDPDTTNYVPLLLEYQKNTGTATGTAFEVNISGITDFTLMSEKSEFTQEEKISLKKIENDEKGKIKILVRP